MSSSRTISLTLVSLVAMVSCSEDYNMTGSTLGELWGRIKGQVNSDWTESYHNVDQLLGQVKTGFSSMVDVGVQVANEVGKQAGAVSEDLNTIAQHAHSEFS